MNRFVSFLKFYTIILLLLLSGCSIYHQTVNQHSVTHLKNIQQQYAPIKNGQIEYYRFGQGSPIVLIPGYVTDISSWNKNFLNVLAQKHDLIIFNNRNVARSVIHSDQYESADLAEDTYQLIQKLKLKDPTILGISMGGMIAQQVAVMHPSSISHLILINTAIAGKQAIHPDPAVEKMMLHRDI